MQNVSAKDKILPHARRGFENQPEAQQTPVIKQVKKKRFSFGTRLLQHRLLRNKKIVIPFAIIFCLILGGIGFYFSALNPFGEDPAVMYAKQIQNMANEAAKYTKLPTDEDPVIATVSDKTKLPHEAFFANAQDGDKILMYKKNKKAILFRPSTKQVIAVATLNFQDSTSTPQQSTSVAGASTSAAANEAPAASTAAFTSPIQTTPQPYHPQGKILVAPQY